MVGADVVGLECLGEAEMGSGSRSLGTNQVALSLSNFGRERWPLHLPLPAALLLPSSGLAAQRSKPRRCQSCRVSFRFLFSSFAAGLQVGHDCLVTQRKWSLA